MPKNLIVLIGPTGVGKTELSLNLAEHFNTSIISSDSRQIYKDLVIGTAAPTPEQLTRIKHYFVGILGLENYYSAARFEEEVLKFLDSYYLTHENALMTGGSMMYIDAVCNGIDDLPTIDQELRKDLMLRYQKEGLDTLCGELKLMDPAYYNQVDLKNPKRVIHALEICIMTGKPYSSLRTNTIKERPFNIIKVGLIREREQLYNRINSRVDQMMADGLLDEARTVYSYKDLNSTNTVGYKELFNYFDGSCTLEEAVDKIKQHSRVYSKKQMTWFKRDQSVTWFHPDQEKEIIDFVQSKLK